MRTVFIAIILSLLLPLSAEAQSRRALVIGLGEQADAGWSKINGDRDVGYVSQMLKNAGYRDVSTLVNRQATKAGIVAAFKSLADRCQKGDVIYIHYSGHGQQITDLDGDEDDGWDEAWIPYDARLQYDENGYKGENHLIDDELNQMLSSLRDKIGDGGKLLVVVDACHSGDCLRGGDEVVRGARDRFVMPAKATSKKAKMAERWLTLSACKDYQVSLEMKDPQVGKLTYSLFSLSAQGMVTIEQIRSFMKKHRGRYEQTPELTGQTDSMTLSDFLRQ